MERKEVTGSRYQERGMKTEFDLLLMQQKIMWDTATQLHQTALQDGALIMQKIRNELSEEKRLEFEKDWQRLIAAIRSAEAELKPPIIGWGLRFVIQEWVDSLPAERSVNFNYDASNQMEQSQVGVFYKIFQQIIIDLPFKFRMNISVSDASLKDTTQILFHLEEGQVFSESVEKTVNIWSKLLKEMGEIACSGDRIALIL